MAVPLVLEAERINPWTFSTSYGEENRENKVGFCNYQEAKYQSVVGMVCAAYWIPSTHIVTMYALGVKHKSKESLKLAHRTSTDNESVGFCDNSG